MSKLRFRVWRFCPLHIDFFFAFQFHFYNNKQVQRTLFTLLVVGKKDSSRIFIFIFMISNPVKESCFKLNILVAFLLESCVLNLIKDWSFLFEKNVINILKLEFWLQISYVVRWRIRRVQWWQTEWIQYNKMGARPLDRHPRRNQRQIWL